VLQEKRQKEEKNCIERKGEEQEKEIRSFHYQRGLHKSEIFIFQMRILNENWTQVTFSPKLTCLITNFFDFWDQ